MKTAPPEGRTEAISRSVSELGDEIAKLAELQAALFREDCEVALHGSRMWLIVVGVGAIMALGAVPILILGIANLLAERSGLHQSTAYVIVSLSTMALSALAIYLVTKRTKLSFAAFNRSWSEFRQNLRWLTSIWKPSHRRAPSVEDTDY